MTNFKKQQSRLKTSLTSTTLTVEPLSTYLPYFWNSQSVLSRGQTWRVFNQREMQWKWKAWLQTPHATVQSSCSACPCAWHSIHNSMTWLRQIAQLSTTISQDHRATALHFFISKRLARVASEDEEAGARSGDVTSSISADIVVLSGLDTTVSWSCRSVVLQFSTKIQLSDCFLSAIKSKDVCLICTLH